MGDKHCDFCLKKIGKYVCPRCNIMYCSVDCFRAEKHVQCSETFYEKCVKEELQLRKPGPDSSKKMLEILSRTQVEDEDTDLDSDDEENDLAERMENVDMDDVNEIWKKLNPHERKEFEKLVSNGEIIKLLPEWQPWWKNYIPKLISENKIQIYPQKESSLDVLTNIPPFTQLTMRPPSATIPFMIANIFMAYAFTTRWFKGNHFDLSVESLTTLFVLTTTSRNRIFHNFIEAYIAFEEDLLNCKWVVENRMDRSIICEDVQDIIKGTDGRDTHFSVKACLSDIFNLLQKALMLMKETTVFQRRFTGAPPTTKEVKLFSKKIMYYLSWSVTYGNQLKDALSQCPFSPMT